MSDDPQTTSPASSGADGSMLTGGAIMLVLALLLSWLPIVGPLIAGFLGGRVIGEEKRAFGVALLPALILALVVWLLLAAFELPVIGAVAGLGVVVIIVVQELPLLFGAWFGGSSGDAARA